MDYELFDLWEDNIAILSPDGVIIYTNESWKQFARDNGLNPSECSERTNYLKVCDESTGRNSNEASNTAEGIREVISGKKQIFKIEYPCHGLDERRWFLLKVTPISQTYPTSVLLQHIDITYRKEAELSLKEKQEQLKKAQSIGNMGSWQFNFNTGTISASEEAYSIYGLEMDKVYNIKEMQKIPLPEYRPMLDETLNKLVSGESEYNVEFKIQRQNDGKIVDIHSVAEYDKQKNTVTGIIKDITAQKKYEEKIKLFKTIFDNANYGSAIADLDGNITHINEYFAKIHGYTSEEIIGEHISIFHNEEQMVDVNRLNESLLEIGYYTNLEVWHTHRDGTTFPMLMTLTVIEDEYNNPQFLSATAIDITEIKDKEYKLRKSELKFKNYINNAPDGIFVTDGNGYYIDVNNAACEITGYSEEELIGMNRLDLLPSDVHKYVIEKYEYVKNKGKADIEIPYLTKGGDERWWRVTAAALSEDRVIGFVKDITHQKNTESALSEALANSQQREKEINELLDSATAILEIDNFKVVARHIFDACARVIGAKAGYVALLSDEGEENELLFLEDGGMPCSVDPDLPMPVRGLRAEAYETGEVVYENDFMASEWIKYMPEGHMVLPNVLFSPLNIEGKTVGLLGFAYKDGDFTEHDAWLAKTFGDYAAIALKNSRNFELLEESEQRYRTIFETAANLITSVDSNGTIVDCNNQIKKFLGYKKSEIIGQPMSKIIHSDYQDKAFESLKEIVVNGFASNKEYKMVKKNGEIIDVIINSSGVDYHDGKFNKTACIINDITESKKRLQKIESLNNMLRCIHDVNQAIIKKTDLNDLLQEICDSLVRYNNFINAWICIYDKNHKINLIAESGFTDKFEEFVHYTKEVGLPYCAEYALQGREYIFLEKPDHGCIGCPLKDEYKDSNVFVSKLKYGDKIYGTISLSIPQAQAKDEDTIALSKQVIGDITFALHNLELEAVRQEAENALLEGKLVAEEANRTKSEFLANMSHELRTPLNSIIGFSQILEKNRNNNLDDKEIKYTSNILNGGENLLGLINNILDISKVEAGKMDYSPERMNLEEIIDNTMILVKPMAYKKSIDLQFIVKPEHLEIYADRMKLKEILYNLLSNAIKFTPEKGIVVVNSECTNNIVQISVSDTGIGIPQEKLEMIFDPFRQADSFSTRKYGGTGLGLALVKKYVEMHGGDIWVESEVGKGSTFTFTIPLKNIKLEDVN
ncbi:sensor histidine kinase [Methanohalophilus sp.]